MRNTIKSKYIARLDHLIEAGMELEEQSKRVPFGKDISGETYYRTQDYIPSEAFNQWKTNCISLLDVLVPPSSIHRKTVEDFHSLSNNPSAKRFGVSFLKGILDDFENGFLEDLEYQIDAELNADFLTQAESLIDHGVSGSSHIPAAVIAGAVLEHGLRSICQSLDPPEAIENNDKRLMMGALIDALKKRGVYNELTAKQLRAFADIRNAAAHGNFDDFSPSQVANMVNGIGAFLSANSP